jgi:hypothetical protein
LVLGLGLATLLTLSSGLLHGRMSQRWGMDDRMQLAAKRLEMFPEQIGVWQQEATFQMGNSAIELLECQGYLQRGYRNRETGDYVKLAVMVGPGSKMSIHVPEICYEANNFTLLGPRQRFQVTAGGQQHTFWSVTFQVNDSTERKMRVLYGWSDGNQWLAPRMPRWSVAGEPVLYKLQLSYVINGGTPQEPADGQRMLSDFMADTLAVLQQLLADPAAVNAPPDNSSPQPS